MIADLRREHGHAELVETHVSTVLLGPDARKIKKPVALPFLDFTTLAAREHACREELRLNRRLAPSTYLDVLPVRREGSRYTWGGSGRVVDWAVQMRRLDDAHNAESLLRRGALGPREIDRIAAVIADFHAHLPASPRSEELGGGGELREHVRENFVALRAREVVGAGVLDALERTQMAALADDGVLAARIAAGKVKEVHGDLRLEHVFFLDEERIEVIDGIEFDEAYRTSDVASEVAFLAMDLARLGHAELGERFLATYASLANDHDLYGVVDFYIHYRACVRAKVARTAREARQYLHVAHALRRPRPVLVGVGGGIASGKSTIAQRAQDELAAPIVSADRTRKHLLGLAPTEHAAGKDAWGGAYDPAFSARVYAEVLRRAGAVLASGRPVIVDASFRSRSARVSAHALAAQHGVPLRFFECATPREVARARLAARDREHSVSDATPEVLDSFYDRYEAVGTELAPAEHVRLPTGGPVEPAFAALDATLARLRGGRGG